MASPDSIKDVIVVLPGIMGSTLAKDGSLVWAPSAGAVLKAILTLGKSIRRLTLPDDIGDSRPKDNVDPVALMPDLHLLPGIWSANIGYGALLDWLRTRFDLIEPSPDDPDRIPNLLPIPYDWRLSNRYNGKLIKKIIEPALDRWRSQGEPFKDAKLIFICHSMGGLVARWYIEKEGGAAVTYKLITLGTPYRGSLNALDQLVNGVRKGIGPFALDLTKFARSLPSVHQLLPEYACIEVAGQLEKTTSISLPNLNPAMVADAMKFHDELDGVADSHPDTAYDLHPIVGMRQWTFTTARISDDSVDPLETIDGNDERGDGTVPRLSATPKNVRPNSPIIRWVPDQHGSLQSNRTVLDELEGILTSKPIIYKAVVLPETTLGVRLQPLVFAGDKVTIEADAEGGAAVDLQVQIFDELGKQIASQTLPLYGGVYRADVGPLSPGAYNVVVKGVETSLSLIAPVRSTVMVWDKGTA